MGSGERLDDFGRATQDDRQVAVFRQRRLDSVEHDVRRIVSPERVY